MPEGPFGFPRLTNLGPLTRKTDKEVAALHITSTGDNIVPEAGIRRTILELDDVTFVGLVPVEVHGISIIHSGGSTAQFVDDIIRVSWEPVYLAIVDTHRYLPYLKGLVAHEYTHAMLEFYDTEQERIQLIDALADAGLFDYRDVDDVIEFYDFPQEQYRIYNNNREFAEHLAEFDWHEGSRPVESLANAVATRYSRLSYEEYIARHNEVREDANRLQNEFMSGALPDFNLPEVWELEWRD